MKTNVKIIKREEKDENSYSDINNDKLCLWGL